MLDGLEAVEVSLSKLERTFRIDSEFFLKNYLVVENILRIKNSIPITELLNISDGNHMKISDDFVENGVPYYRGQDVSSFFIEQANPIHITKKAFDLPVMKRSYLKQNDILLSIVGTIGKLSLVKENNQATCSCKLAILRPKIKESNYISIFLNSKYGNSQIERFTRGAVQQGLLLEDMNQLLIPNFSIDIQKAINELIESSYQKLEKSKTLYKQAEELLLKELDLLDFKPSEQNIAIKSFKESFLSTGRLDSEYYQPKYDELIIHIQKTKFDKLDNIVKIKKSIEPGSEAYQDDGIPFVRVSNVTKFGITDTEIHLSKNILKEEDLKKLYPTKDTILLSKDGTVGIAYKIKNELEMITSSALLHLAIKRDDVMPEYLTLVLNSVIVQLQAQRDAGGSIIQHWKPSEIGEILIPIIDISIQTQIEEKIKQSFELKVESKRLLDLAKRAVEVAIEKDEDEAKKLILGGC